MSNQLLDTDDLSILRSRRKRFRYFLQRQKNIILAKAGLGNIDFLINKNFLVDFPEEEVFSIQLPRTSNFSRSVNLFDQREVLHRAIVAHALRNLIIDSTKNIIDVGAQNGDCALVWAKLINGSVYAIDPSNRNLSFIRRVALLNSIDNIKTLNYAIGDTEGHLYPLYSLDHTPFSTTPPTSYSKKNEVCATTFDLLYDRGLLCSIGYIHLDVEGMELDALRGAQQVIKKCMPIITFEAHITVDNIKSIFHLLSSLKYSVFMINEATPGGRPDCINFLALPRSKEIVHQVSMLNKVKPNQVFFKTTVGENLVPMN